MNIRSMNRLLHYMDVAAKENISSLSWNVDNRSSVSTIV